MDLLLDTHVFLWWDAESPQLGATACAAIANPENRIFISAASVWEISIKRAKGKLVFSGSSSEAIGQNGFLPLAMDPIHAEAAGNLDWSHTDPFDRMLVAQARLQSLVLVHADHIIADFHQVPQLWAE
jgi:PIN domain nuclease of toxin-antitoxin system